MEVAKRLDCAVILVGHVTKEGAVAGPRVLEHLVDCVLFFEGERERSFRTLRALKNRFGATSEVGVFEMRSGGLVEVVDPSARFVAEASAAPGLGRALLDGGHAAAAGRGPGAGRADRDRAAAAGRQRDRPQPPGDGARRARPPRRPVAGRRRRVRQRRRRRPGRRARRRPRGRAGARLGAPRRAARRRGRAARSPASARSGSPASCARSATPTAASPRRVKFGLAPVLAPAGRASASRGSRRRPTLRGAIRAALGAPPGRRPSAAA